MCACIHLRPAPASALPLYPHPPRHAPNAQVTTQAEFVKRFGRSFMNNIKQVRALYFESTTGLGGSAASEPLQLNNTLQLSLTRSLLFSHRSTQSWSRRAASAGSSVPAAVDAYFYSPSFRNLFLLIRFSRRSPRLWPTGAARGPIFDFPFLFLCRWFLLSTVSTPFEIPEPASANVACEGPMLGRRREVAGRRRAWTQGRSG